VVTLGYRDGKRHRKHVYGRTRREVWNKLTTVLREYHQGMPVPVGAQSLEQFLVRWLEDVVRPTVPPPDVDVLSAASRSEWLSATVRVRYTAKRPIVVTTCPGMGYVEKRVVPRGRIELPTP